MNNFSSVRRALLVLVASCLAEDIVLAQSMPLEPDAAQAAFVIEPGFRIDLVAAEPDVIDPVHFAFAADGRLWVVEYSDYPNGPDPGTPGKSRIRVLTDADRDGRYENPVTFAEGLLFANSLMFWKDGVIVTTDGKILFMKDADGDGRADQVQEWFKGFATENPQLRCNHPTLGLDGWIYVANGLRGGAIVPGQDYPWPKPESAEQPVSISGMDFRFHPHTGQYDAVTGNGQFGLCFDDFGNRFVCSNRNPCKHVVIEDQWLKSDPDLQVEQLFEDVSPAAEKSQLFPISRTWTTSNLHANQFTAACGVTIFRGLDLPGLYGNSFTCEPTANLLHRDLLTPRGATFTSQPAQSGVEFLATTDEWFRPVNLAHGPAAALYVADMYRAVIEHPQFMPEELKSRPDLLLGLDRGRIWKIAAVDGTATLPATSSLQGFQLRDLVEQLAHDNAWRRDTAFRLLWESQNPGTPALLRDLCLRKPHAPGTVMALWLLHLHNALQVDELRSAMARNDGPIAEHVVQLLGREVSNLPAIPENIQVTYKQGMLPELNELLIQLSTQVKPGSWTPEAGRPAFRDRLLFELLKIFPMGESAFHRLVVYADVLDNWGQDPFYRAAALHRSGKYLTTLASMLLQREATGSHGHPVARMRTLREMSRLLGRRRDDYEIERLLERAFAKPPADSSLTEERRLLGQTQVLLGLFEGLRQSELLARSISRSRPPVLAEIERAMDLGVQYLSRPEVDAQAKQEIIRTLGFDMRQETRTALAALLDHPQLAPVTVDVLAQIDDPQMTQEFLRRFPRSTPAMRVRILQALTANPNRVSQLLDALESDQIHAVEIDQATVQRLLRTREESLRTRAAAIFERQRPADRTEVIAAYKPALGQSPKLFQGREVFARNCATCHKIGDLGVNVAPDISDSRVRTPEYLLTHILDPNLAIDNNYFSYTVVDVQGRIFTGVIDSETSTGVTLKQAEGKIVTIPRNEIEEMKSSGQSLMPVGLEKNITPQQMADLIGFIKNWRYLDGQIPGVGK